MSDRKERTAAERAFHHRYWMLLGIAALLVIPYSVLSHELEMTGAQATLGGLMLLVLIEFPGLLWCMWPMREEAEKQARVKEPTS